MVLTPLLERHRAFLLRLLVLLKVAAAHCGSRAAYYNALRVMRPAESALRRLIAIAARDVVVKIGARRAFPVDLTLPESDGERVGNFALFDPRLHPAPPRLLTPKGAGPRIRFLGEPFEIEPPVIAGFDQLALTRRLARFERALKGLDAQAKRLARRRAQSPDSVKRPMRPGRPPGYRARSDDPAGSVLQELQQLSLIAYADTS